MEAKTGHKTGDTRLLAIPFLDAVINRRLMADTSKLQPVDATQGWVGNTINHPIIPVAQYEGNLVDTAWLPNEKSARKWQQYNTLSRISALAQKAGIKRAEKLEKLFNFIGFTQHTRQSNITPDQNLAAPIALQVMWLDIGGTC